MIIGGIQKNSLIDFPGKICCVIFTAGCNFDCPYCHNPALGSPPFSTIDPEEVFNKALDMGLVSENERKIYDSKLKELTLELNNKKNNGKLINI